MTSDHKTRGAHMRLERKSLSVARHEEHLANNQLRKAASLMEDWCLDRIEDSEFWNEFKPRMQRYKELRTNARKHKARASFHYKEQQRPES